MVNPVITLKMEKRIRNALIATILIFILGCGMNLQGASTPADPVPSLTTMRAGSHSPTGVAVVNASSAEPTLRARATEAPTPTPVPLDPQRWEHFYSPAEGPRIAFYDIAEAKDGTMWFVGSLEKIYRYDLKNWTIYQPDDIPDFQGKWPHSVAAAPDGTIWVGTDQNEIVSFDGTTWASQTVEEGGYRANAIVSILIRSNGELCAVSLEGMSCQNKGKWTHHRFDLLKEEVKLANAVLTPQDEIWVSLFNGWLYFYDGHTWESHRFGDWMGLIAASHDDSLWVYTGVRRDGGLGKQSRSGNIIYLDVPPALVDNPPFSLLEMQDGTLWYGCGGGDGGLGVVIYQDNGIFKTIDGILLKKGEDPFLYYYRYPFSDINKIFQSKDGSVWLATSNGIFRYSLNK